MKRTGSGYCAINGFTVSAVVNAITLLMGYNISLAAVHKLIKICMTCSC